MNLRALDFTPVMNTSEHDLVNNFFTPALENAISYNRGVGFFSAGWLRITMAGMASFAQHSGYTW